MSNKLSEIIIKGLQSENDKYVVEAIKSIRKSTNTGYLPYVLALLETNQPESVIREISSLLNDIRDKESTNYIVEAIKNPKIKKYLHLVVSSCWISDNDFGEHLMTFTDLVLKENYQVAFEALTVIENSLHRVTDKDKELCLDRLNSEIENVSADKRQLVSELVRIVENFKDISDLN